MWYVMGFAVVGGAAIGGADWSMKGPPFYGMPRPPPWSFALKRLAGRALENGVSPSSANSVWALDNLIYYPLCKKG